MNNPIVNEILRMEKEVFSNISLESISVYVFLKNEYEKGNIKDNTLFQFVFRSYYRLDNGGLGDDLKKKYFELLADKQNDLRKILLELYSIPNIRNLQAIQFSFATKLLHTINNNNPIFDAKVSRVFTKRVSGSSMEEKIDSCLEIYEFLKNMYSMLIVDEQIIILISDFREKFSVKKNDISDIKILDFIIWSLGKLKSR